MEQTNRQIISDVITELRSMNIDDRISNRFVLSRLRDKTKAYIKQDLDSRRLFKITSLWRTINCLDMCPLPFMECACDIPKCNFVSKSVKKLPKLFDSNYGTLIKVFTVTGAKEYKQTTLSEYKNIKNREYTDATKYFWIDGDGYLYIPDSEVKAVLVQGLFETPHDVNILNEIKGAECAKILDDMFICPGHLFDLIKKDTILELAKIYKGLVSDEKPNQNVNDK